MKQHTAVRFPPVSGYDIPGLERWLQRMAARGMQFSLTLGPLTLFLPAEPTSLRIHLEPAHGLEEIWYYQNERTPGFCDLILRKGGLVMRVEYEGSKDLTQFLPRFAQMLDTL